MSLLVSFFILFSSNIFAGELTSPTANCSVINHKALGGVLYGYFVADLKCGDAETRRVLTASLSNDQQATLNCGSAMLTAYESDAKFQNSILREDVVLMMGNILLFYNAVYKAVDNTCGKDKTFKSIFKKEDFNRPIDVVSCFEKGRQYYMTKALLKAIADKKEEIDGDLVKQKDTLGGSYDYCLGKLMNPTGDLELDSDGLPDPTTMAP